MADVILFHPKIGYWDFAKTKPNLPLNLLHTAKFVSQEYEVKIIDQRVNQNWRGTFIKELKKNPICVGSTSMTGEPLKNVLEAARLVKERDTPFIIGGPHATLLPRQTTECELIDYVVLREGELTFYELVKSLDKEEPLRNVRGIAYFEGNNYVQTPPRKFLDLNETPPLPYNLVNIKDYLYKLRGEPTLNIETSRGCPYSCTFCYNNEFHQCRWRALNAENTFNLVREVVEDLGARRLWIIDDNLFVDLKRIEKVAGMIINEGYDVKWDVQGTNIDLILKGGDDFLKIIAKAGCDILRFGIETGSPRILKMLQKRVSLQDVLKVNKILMKYDITPSYNFMVGFPHETLDDLKMTTNLIIKLLDENPQAKTDFISCFTPYPGTKLWEESIKLGFKPPSRFEDWVDYDWDASHLPWISEERKKMLHLLSLLAELVDYKVEDASVHFPLRLISKLYRPIARYRVKNLYFGFMIESLLETSVKRFLEYRQTKTL